MDMVERMSEGMDKKPKAVIVRCNVCHSIARRTDARVQELLGLETDEEYGVSLKATKIG